MKPRRWLNPSQPQTLQIAVFLLYARALFMLLDLLGNDLWVRFVRNEVPFGLLLLWFIVFGGVAGATGIATEDRWGYPVALAAAFTPIAIKLWALGFDILDFDLIGLMFEVALVALLLHPQSREYQRIWFK